MKKTIFKHLSDLKNYFYINRKFIFILIITFGILSTFATFNHLNGNVSNENIYFSKEGKIVEKIITDTHKYNLKIGLNDQEFLLLTVNDNEYYNVKNGETIHLLFSTQDSTLSLYSYKTTYENMSSIIDKLKKSDYLVLDYNAENLDKYNINH